MRCYGHLSITEREKILYHLAKGESKRSIARKLGRSASTISKELKRCPGEYSLVAAQEDYEILDDYNNKKYLPHA